MLALYCCQWYTRRPAPSVGGAGLRNHIKTSDSTMMMEFLDLLTEVITRYKIIFYKLKGSTPTSANIAITTNTVYIVIRINP